MLECGQTGQTPLGDAFGLCFISASESKQFHRTLPPLVVSSLHVWAILSRNSGRDEGLCGLWPVPKLDESRTDQSQNSATGQKLRTSIHPKSWTQPEVALENILDKQQWLAWGMSQVLICLHWIGRSSWQSQAKTKPQRNSGAQKSTADFMNFPL